MRTYHLGLIKGSGDCYPLHRNGHRASTVILQARRCIDYLSCSLWKYYGERIITKQELKSNKVGILQAINKEHNTSFISIVID